MILRSTSGSLLSLALAITLPFVEAREPTAGQRLDLGGLIDGLQKRYSAMRGLAAVFTQTYYGADGRTLRERGRLYLKRPGKARWEYTAPEKKLFISDGKNIYFYVMGERHATRTSVKQSVDAQIPFLFLLGRGNLRRDFSRIEVAAGEQPVTAGNVVLRLSPKRAPEEFKQLLAEVNPSTFEVRRLIILERKGGRMDFNLTDLREGHVAPDSHFAFTAPPGVTVRQAR